VPPEIVVAIIGVETEYGRNTGSYRVVDALSTLAFDYPPRAAFFRSELEHFLVLARDSGANVFDLKGSYAGAMGMPQFMPGSYNRYALDYDGNGRADLTGPIDAIGSVANFLYRHGWARGGPIAVPVRVEGERPTQLLAAGIKPSLRADALAASGVSLVPSTGGVLPAPSAGGIPLVPFTSGMSAEPAPLGTHPSPSAVSPDTLVALVELAGMSPEYRLAFNNFYVLTRYNRSSLYATAVLELAQAIRGPGTPAQYN
jgi:membrane-bound lytic murein transglycosylase B